MTHFEKAEEALRFSDTAGASDQDHWLKVAAIHAQLAAVETVYATLAVSTASDEAVAEIARLNNVVATVSRLNGDIGKSRDGVASQRDAALVKLKEIRVMCDDIITDVDEDELPFDFGQRSMAKSVLRILDAS